MELQEHIIISALVVVFFGGVIAKPAAGQRVYLKLLSIGDSMQHDVVWSTGYDANDAVNSMHERFEDTCPDNYNENNAARDCVRRKEFHPKIRDIYNPILGDVLQEYIADGRLPSAYYIDIFDIQFGDDHVNNGGCFHSSVAGHALLAEERWDRSPWALNPPICKAPAAPWIQLLMLDDEN